MLEHQSPHCEGKTLSGGVNCTLHIPGMQISACNVFEEFMVQQTWMKAIVCKIRCADGSHCFHRRRKPNIVLAVVLP